MTQTLDPNTAPFEKPARKKLWIWRFFTLILPLLVIVGAIVAFAIMGALKDEPEEKEEAVKAQPVIVATALRDNVTLTVSAQGEVQPRTQIHLAAQVTGRITYMSPKLIDGGRFNKGDLLARIEPAEYEMRVVQAGANVAQAQTVLDRERSEAALAKRDWEDIGDGQPASPLTLREPQMAEAAAKLEAAKSQLAEAELQLARTSIYAPFKGRVVNRLIAQGEFVSAGTRLGQVYASDIMDVRLPLTNKDLREAGLTLGYQAGSKLGIPVTLSADVAGDYASWPAHIVRTDSRYDAQTRVLYAYAEMRDPFGGDGPPLAPGLFVTAKIEGQSRDNIIVIPRAALRGTDQVYVAESDNTLSIKTVSVLSSDKDSALILTGLSAGDQVITSPIRGVAEDMKIEIAKPGASDDSLPTTGETP